MSRLNAKFFSALLVLASAALHIGAVSAADSTGDIQQQMRELLTGTQTTHFVPQAAAREAKVATRAVDSQEFAKQLLLGSAAYRVGGPEMTKHPEVAGASARTQAHNRRAASEDMQAAVRQLLLGQPHAADAS